MGFTSDEYLAKLGFDSSDMEGSVQRLITLTGALSASFPALERELSKVERLMLSTSTGTKKQAIADRQAAQAARERAAAMKQVETNLRALERRSEFVNTGLSSSLGRPDSGYRPTTFGKIENTDAQATKKAAEAQKSLTAEIKATEQARKAELAALRAAIQGRYADQSAAEADQAAQEKAYEAHIRGLSRARYAVYDLSNAALVGGAALVGMAALGAKAAIDMQRDFAQVVRTTGAAGTSVGRLREEFRDLYTSIPASYQSLTEIGALGGQLDIPISRLKEFTRVTTEFSATTDVAVDQAATAFGRLDELLPDVAGNYEGLADSILKVGVNSVATESQIISITSQIAPLANVAKLSSQETIGLAGALASLGVAPENARGNVTRLFGLIDSAVATGGSRLDDFAKLSGRTSDQFVSDWQTAGKSQGALLDLFVGINQQGRSTTAVLQDIGLTATRDQVTFSKLAQNTDLWANSVRNAENAGGELEQQYSVISSTVSAKLQVLTNNFNQLVATVSSSAGGIGLLIDPLIGLLSYLDRLASNPGAATIATLGLALTGVAGVTLLVTGLLGRLVGNYYAGVTAAAELTGQTSLLTAAKRIATGQVNLFSIGLRSESAAAREAAAAQNTLAAATSGASAAATSAAASTAALTGANAAAAAGMKTATNWAGRLSGILGRGGIVGSLILAIPLVFDFGNAIADWATDGTQAAAGLNKTTADYLKLLKSGGGQEALQNLVNNASELGSVGSDNFVRFLRDISFSAGGIRAVEEQLTAVDGALAELAQTDAAQANDALNYLAVELGKAGFSAEEFRNYFSQSTAALEDGTLIIEQAARAQEDLTEQIRDTISANTEFLSGYVNVQRSLRSLGQGFGRDGFDLSGISEAGIGNLDKLLNVVEAIADQTPGDSATIVANFQALYSTLVRAGAPTQALQFLQDAISQLLASNGGEVGRATIGFESFFGGISDGAAEAEKASKSARQEIRTLVDYANDLSGVLNRSFEIRFGGLQGQDAIASGWNRISEGIQSAKDQILDYNDGIADAEQELVDLNVRMREYQATLQEISADRAVNEYFLRVANRFGNTLRAGQISADIAKNEADAANVRNSMQKAEQDRVSTQKEILDLNKQIADAQERANFTLTGNTAAAIANRAALLGVIGDYNSYITALATAGTDSETLKRIAGDLQDQFVNQADQAGLSGAQIDLYSGTFGDLKTAIENVPKDITVNGDPDPAIQALNEFKARYYQDKAIVESSPITVPFSIPKPDFATPLREGLNEAQQAMNQWQQESKKGGGIGSVSFLDLIGGFFGAFNWDPLRPFTDREGFVNAILKNYGLGGGARRGSGGSYASGTAWTGSGPANRIAGVVHNREAVLNQRATSMIPSQWINAWNQGRQPVMPTVAIQGGSAGGSAVTDLGSKTMRELSQIMAMMRTILGDDAIAGMVDRAHSSVRSVGG